MTVDYAAETKREKLHNLARSISEPVFDTLTSYITRGDQFADVREAYITEETSTGVKIGSWHIDCIKHQNNIRTYNIRENTLGQVVSDLSLYEAAYSIVKLLSKNVPLHSTQIITILKLEADYSKALNDTLHFKHTLASKTLPEIRREILESLYETAKYNAALAIHRIKEMKI